MPYVIKYQDGAYEFDGNGRPCGFDEAKRFDTLEEAQWVAKQVWDNEIIEIDATYKNFGVARKLDQ